MRAAYPPFRLQLDPYEAATILHDLIMALAERRHEFDLEPLVENTDELPQIITTARNIHALATAMEEEIARRPRGGTAQRAAFRAPAPPAAQSVGDC